MVERRSLTGELSMACMMHIAHNNKSPALVSDVTLPVSRDLSRSRLRSADTTDFIVPGLSSGRERSVSLDLLFGTLFPSLFDQ